MDLIGNGNIKLSETKMRTISKQFAGKVSWLLQTRYDLSFLILQFRTNMVSALTDKDILGKIIAISKRICNQSLEFKEVIAYYPLSQERSNGYPAQLIGFADDSFASAEDPSSIESGILTLGRPIYRNGPIACMGRIIHFYSREIQRIR